MQPLSSVLTPFSLRPPSCLLFLLAAPEAQKQTIVEGFLFLYLKLKPLKYICTCLSPDFIQVDKAVSIVPVGRPHSFGMDLVIPCRYLGMDEITPPSA